MQTSRWVCLYRILLLHDLAKYVDEERISKLFIRDRVFVVFGQLGGELVSLARTMPFA